MSPPNFNLRELVHKILDTSSEPDIGTVADEVARRVPSKHLRDALRVTLRGYVRVMAHQPSAPPPTSNTTTPNGRSSAGDQSIPSRKVAAIRDWYGDEMHRRLHTGPNGQWKFYRDCTAEDFAFGRAERQQQAAWIAASGDACGRREKLIRDCGAATYGDVPSHDVAQLLKEEL